MRAAWPLLLTLLAARAAAAPSGLNTVPTADVVPPGQLVAQLQNGNTELRGQESLFHRPEPAYQTQFGLFVPRVEAGLDLVTPGVAGGYRPVCNLKAVALEEGYTRPAVALGAAQIGRGFATVYYVLASRTLNYGQLQYRRFRAHHRNLKLHGIRLHVGALGPRAALRGMLGADIEISDHFVLDADAVAGSDHAMTLGGVWVIDPRSSVQVALLAGNADRRLDGLQVAFTRQVGLPVRRNAEHDGD